MLGNKRHIRNSGQRRVDPKVTKLAGDLFSALDTPFSLSQKIRLDSGDLTGLVSATVDPHGYTCAETFSRDYLAAEAFSKYPSWDLGIDRASVAITKFLESEEICRLTNARLKRPYPTDLKNPCGVAAVMFTARQKIRRLLRDFHWSDAERFFDFGPGATYALPRRKRNAYYKFSGIPEATQECAVAGDALVKSIPGWTFHLACLTGAQSGNDSLVDVVPGNRITTVPKNAKTDRCIAIEPLINGMLQKGIGGVIRNRLRKVGVNLNDQTPNQELARVGAITGDFATIDLKSASDSVSSQLVVELLPPTWVSAIELCRSSRGVLPDGKIIFYHKVSSMGNGFTFELESLIFWAICSSVIDLSKNRERRLCVYGDDLIVPTAVAADVIDVLAYCGFSTNEKKTFVTGPFRESCGKHYFLDNDVTPFYLRDEVSIAQLLLYANNVRRYASFPSWGLDGRFKTVYEGAISLLPRKLQQPSLPDGYGDSALIGDFDECRPRRAKRGFEGFSVVVRLPRAVLLQADGYPYLLSWLLTASVPRFRNRSTEDTLQGLRIEQSKKTGCIPVDIGYENSNVLVPQWVNKGPWL